MTKLLQVSFLGIILTLLISNPLTAQISLGGSINYDTDLKRIGFMAKAKYLFHDEEWAASPSFSIYPSEGATVKIIDVDAHYHVVSLFADAITIYGLAGLGFVNFVGNNNVALNGGVGVSIPTNGDLNVFGEMKFRVNKGTGTQIGGGVLYEF